MKRALSVLKFLAVLYLFFLCIELMGCSFKLLGSDAAKQLLTVTDNPFVGLLIGLGFWYRARIRVVGLEGEQLAEGEKLKWAEASQERLKESFTTLAQDALRANTETLTTQAKQDLKNLVKPLSENVTNLEKNVRDIEKAREALDIK